MSRWVSVVLLLLFGCLSVAASLSGDGMAGVLALLGVAGSTILLWLED